MVYKFKFTRPKEDKKCPTSTKWDRIKKNRCPRAFALHDVDSAMANNFNFNFKHDAQRQSQIS